jgi:hypothetical protein
MKFILFCALVLVACLMPETFGRKTPGNRTPLGKSRSNSVQKQYKLSGPTTDAEKWQHLEDLKKRAQKKIEFQQKRKDLQKKAIEEDSDEGDDESADDAAAIEVDLNGQGESDETEISSKDTDATDAAASRRPLLRKLLLSRRTKKQ